MTQEVGGQDLRDRDDRERLAEESQDQVRKLAAGLRGTKVPIETEPPATYRP